MEYNKRRKFFFTFLFLLTLLKKLNGMYLVCILLIFFVVIVVVCMYTMKFFNYIYFSFSLSHPNISEFTTKWNFFILNSMRLRLSLLKCFFILVSLDIYCMNLIVFFRIFHISHNIIYFSHSFIVKIVELKFQFLSGSNLKSIIYQQRATTQKNSKC